MSIVKVQSNTYTVEPLYQWDIDQTLEVYGLSLASVPEVHFTNVAMGRAIVRQATMDAAGVVRVEVPNSLLQKPYTISAYICTYSGSTFETQYKIELPVKERKQPEDYTLEDDEEVYSFNKLENMLNERLVTYGEASNIAKQAATAQSVATTSAATAAEAAASAEADAATAAGAKTAAESALAGVEAALDNIPAGSTVVINDLTTGGAAAALSAEMGKVLAQRPNPNLLRNWYMLSPVNQKGRNEYTGEYYGIDLWKSNLTTNTRVTLGTNGVTFENISDGNAFYFQLLETPLPAGTYTLSILVTDYVRGTGTQDISFNFNKDATILARNTITGPGLFSVTATMDAGKCNSIRGPLLPGSSVTIAAVKLERGSTQTLAHQDSNGNWVLNEIPDYADELAKCQRYYQLFSSAEVRPTALADYRPSMRANPQTGAIVIDGVTYYYADANL